MEKSYFRNNHQEDDDNDNSNYNNAQYLTSVDYVSCVVLYTSPIESSQQP